MKAPQRARRSTACPATTTKTRNRPKPPKAKKRGRFETLVRRYYSGVYSFASRLTDDPVEAVVLTHVAFISTRTHLQTGRNEVEIVTILLKAVIRAAGIAKLELTNGTTRVDANTPITGWNLAPCKPRKILQTGFRFLDSWPSNLLFLPSDLVTFLACRPKNASAVDLPLDPKRSSNT